MNNFFLLFKASHHIEDNQGRTPLHWAAASPSMDNLKVMYAPQIFLIWLQPSSIDFLLLLFVLKNIIIGILKSLTYKIYMEPGLLCLSLPFSQMYHFWKKSYLLPSFEKWYLKESLSLTLGMILWENIITIGEVNYEI